MGRQKRIALVNDITGFGRCSITVELPIISAMKIQACPLPTAILSVHTGFPSHFMDDYTGRMKPYIENWRENNIEFDGICTGFFGSAEQIDIVIDFIEKFKGENTMIMVDPVMGDHGKIYASYTKEMCIEMRKLLAHADLVTPNLTEACELLGEDYPEDGKISDAALREMAEAIADRGPKQVVITGMNTSEHIKNLIYEKGKGFETLRVKKVGGDRSGAGDAFAAIVAASIVNGETLSEAVQKAALFINKVLAFAVKLNLPWNYGLPIEEYLTTLR